MKAADGASRPNITSWTGDLLREAVGRLGPTASIEELNNILRVMSRWRAQMLANTYIVRQGPKVYQGPFAGLEYVTIAVEGAAIARLLGTYESELHPHIEAFVAADFDCVIDVGCAEGYYAVGLARRMPEVTVYAYDISDWARECCRMHAEKNGVADRIVIGREFRADGFEAFAGRRVLVWMDVEGAEDDLLRPELSPALAGMTLVVETHEMLRPGVRERLMERFSPTHDIVQVDQQPKAFDMPPWMTNLAHLDQLLAVWEWRSGPTPWLVMTPRGG
jgi:hypothetical protein